MCVFIAIIYLYHDLFLLYTIIVIIMIIVIIIVIVIIDHFFNLVPESLDCWKHTLLDRCQVTIEIMNGRLTTDSLLIKTTGNS